MRQLPLVETAMGRQTLALLGKFEAACTAADDLAEASVELFEQHPDAAVRAAVEDLLLAAEENPAAAEMLASVPAGAARIEDLEQHGPSAGIWYPLTDPGASPCAWHELAVSGKSR